MELDTSPRMMRKYKFFAILVLGTVIFLVSKKLFISLFSIFLGGFLVITFGRNIFARDPKVVEFGIVIGIIFILAGIIYLLIG